MNDSQFPSGIQTMRRGKFFKVCDSNDIVTDTPLFIPLSTFAYLYITVFFSGDIIIGIAFVGRGWGW